MGDSLKDASKMLSDFEAQLGKLRHHFKRLQTRQNEDGDDLHQLSQGVKTMSDNPMNSVLAVALSPVTDGLQALATHTKRQAGLTKGTLLAKLKLHRQLALAIIEQFKGREKLSKDIDALNAKIKELLNQSTKLAGKPGKEKQVAELEAKANDLQQKVSEGRDKYAAFSQLLAWELERYNKNKNRDLVASLQEFAISYTEFTSKQHELWGGLSAGVMQNVRKVTSEAASLGDALADLQVGASPRSSFSALPPSHQPSYGGGDAATAAPQPPAAAAAPPPASPPKPPQPQSPGRAAAPPSPFAATSTEAPTEAPNPFQAPGSTYEPNVPPPPPPGGSLSAALWESSAAGGSE